MVPLLVSAGEVDGRLQQPGHRAAYSGHEPGQPENGPARMELQQQLRSLEAAAKDPESGKSKYCILQAEDEIAAIGTVVGAGWNGARAFTSTSGPGLSLMSEFIGFAYYAESRRSSLTCNV